MDPRAPICSSRRARCDALTGRLSRCSGVLRRATRRLAATSTPFAVLRGPAGNTTARPAPSRTATARGLIRPRRCSAATRSVSPRAREIESAIVPTRPHGALGRPGPPAVCTEARRRDREVRTSGSAQLLRRRGEAVLGSPGTPLRPEGGRLWGCLKGMATPEGRTGCCHHSPVRRRTHCLGPGWRENRNRPGQRPRIYRRPR
jgi:hypothetical protein